tara:strand:- start:3877 stop:4167 length:291 start_codon:yes stop_codon:yes gene_type:complete
MPKGFGYGPDAGKSKGPKMESDKQEKENLLSDNPVAKDASGGRPWISKHFRSSMGSPALSHHEKGSMAKKLGDLDKDGKMSSYEANRQAAIEKNMK